LPASARPPPLRVCIGGSAHVAPVARTVSAVPVTVFTVGGLVCQDNPIGFMLCIGLSDGYGPVGGVRAHRPRAILFARGASSGHRAANDQRAHPCARALGRWTPVCSW